MDSLSRGAYIELGISIPTVPLTRWAVHQRAAARGREERLEHLGIHSPYLTELESLIEKVREQQSILGREKSMPPAEIVEAQRIREEAFATWQEAKHIVKVEFGSTPEMPVKFRLGVRTELLIAHLTKELDCVVSLMGEHTSSLGWRGVRETFQKLGVALIAALASAQSKVDAVCNTLSPALAEQCVRKGRLYDLTRKLVRIGRLAFRHEPEQADAFNYAVLRRELRGRSDIPIRPDRVAGRWSHYSN